MPVSRALRRLLRVLDLEEEQTRRTLDTALAELRLLEHSRAIAAERDRAGRRLVTASAVSGEWEDRLAGLEETRAALRRVAEIAPRLRDAERAVAAQRAVFLAKRVERRQAETLIQNAESQDAIEAARRSQQGLDDWYLNRLHRAGLKADPERRAKT
jgi:hypothetical protein